MYNSYVEAILAETRSELALVERGGKCCHRWSVETPNGPKSKGICKLCGMVKFFNNYIEDYGSYPIGEDVINLKRYGHK